MAREINILSHAMFWLLLSKFQSGQYTNHNLRRQISQDKIRKEQSKALLQTYGRYG